MMSRRVMGKASFVELQDSKGRIQVYVTRDDICPGEDKTYITRYSKNCSTSRLHRREGHCVQDTDGRDLGTRQGDHAAE
jgi:lysyl-tRNA synthetase class II